MLPHRHFLVALSILRVWPMGHLYVSVNICQVFSRAAADHKSGMACRFLNELSPCKPCKLSPCHVQYVQYVLILGEAKDEETQIVGGACLERPVLQMPLSPLSQGIPHAWDAATKAKGRRGT